MNYRLNFIFSVFCFLLSFNSFSTILGDTKVCPGSSSSYVCEQVVDAVSYNWSFTGGWNAVSLTNEVTVQFGNESGTLTLNVVRSNGSTVVDQLTIEFLPTPTASFQVDTNVVSMFSPQVFFTNTSVNSTSYKWDFGDAYPSIDKNTNHYFEESPAKYTVKLIAFNAAGCSDTAISEIKVVEDLVYFIPSAFTPNDDNYNQVFRPIVTCGSNELAYHLSIYNRSEGLVFESYNALIGWDGTFGEKNQLMEDGIYTWILDLNDGGTNKSYSLKGHVHLLK